MEDLELLFLIADTGSLGSASRELDCTQPTVTRRMDELECELGVRLLDRSRRGSRLTEEGQAVAGWARELLAAADDFAGSVRTLSTRTRSGRASGSA